MNTPSRSYRVLHEHAKNLGPPSQTGLDLLARLGLVFAIERKTVVEGPVGEQRQQERADRQSRLHHALDGGVVVSEQREVGNKEQLSRGVCLREEGVEKERGVERRLVARLAETHLDVELEHFEYDATREGREEPSPIRRFGVQDAVRRLRPLEAHARGSLDEEEASRGERDASDALSDEVENLVSILVQKHHTRQLRLTHRQHAYVVGDLQHVRVLAVEVEGELRHVLRDERRLGALVFLHQRLVLPGRVQ